MVDQELEAPELVEEEVPEEEPKPDPREEAWKSERLRLETERDQYKTMAALAARAQPQAQPLRQVEPDFDEAAGRIGMTADQLRGITGVINAQYAPLFEEIRSGIKSLQPSDEDRLQTIIRDAGYEVDEGDAVAATYRARKSLGADAPVSQVMRAAVADLKSRKPQEPHRTGGTGGGSLPPGRKPTAAEKKYPNLVEIIKADQRKRGLYAY